MNRKQLDIVRDRNWVAALQSLDTRTLYATQDHPQRELLTKLALAISFTADGWLYFLVLPAIIIIKPDETRDRKSVV